MDSTYEVALLQKLSDGSVAVTLRETGANASAQETRVLPAGSPLIGTLTIGTVVYGRLQLNPFA